MNSCLELVQNACQPLNDVQSRSLPACAPNWLSHWSLSFDRLSKIRRRQVCGHIIALRRETMHPATAARTPSYHRTRGQCADAALSRSAGALFRKPAIRILFPSARERPAIERQSSRGRRAGGRTCCECCKGALISSMAHSSTRLNHRPAPTVTRPSPALRRCAENHGHPCMAGRARAASARNPDSL
jgi:hypothetical protein